MEQEFKLFNVSDREYVDTFAIMPSGNIVIEGMYNHKNRYILLKSVPNKKAHNTILQDTCPIFELDRVSFKMDNCDEIFEGLVYYDNDICGWFIKCENDIDRISFNSIDIKDVINYGTCVKDPLFLTSREDVIKKYYANILSNLTMDEKIDKFFRTLRNKILLKIKQILN